MKKTIKSTILTLAVITMITTIVGLAQARQMPKATITMDCVGATSKANFDMLSQIILDGDEAAYKKMLLEGSLVLLDKGEVVTFVESSLLGGWTKVRKSGSTKLLWVTREWVSTQ